MIRKGKVRIKDNTKIQARSQPQKSGGAPVTIKQGGTENSRGGSRRGFTNSRGGVVGSRRGFTNSRGGG